MPRDAVDVVLLRQAQRRAAEDDLKRDLTAAAIDAGAPGVLAVLLRGRHFGLVPQQIVPEAAQMLEALALMGFYVATPADILKMTHRALAKAQEARLASNGEDKAADPDDGGTKERLV